MEYKLIACDMDATSLNSEKIITPRTLAAMKRAVEMGKIVAFSTGRNISIVKPYMELIPGMRYAITSSGGAVNDIFTGERLYEDCMSFDTAKKLIEATAGRDVLQVLYLGDKSYCNNWTAERAADFGVADFEEMYRKYMTKVPSVADFLYENPAPVQKFNFIYTKEADCAAVYERIKDLPISFTSLMPKEMEINAAGVNKAGGLRGLCRSLGVDMAQCIAIGDAQNDIEVIKEAGLGVAMENASDDVKAAADAVVPDCDHDGVAVCIESFLLAE